MMLVLMWLALCIHVIKALMMETLTTLTKRRASFAPARTRIFFCEFVGLRARSERWIKRERESSDGVGEGSLKDDFLADILDIS